MSQFLGRQDCIESLRRDLVDLQGAILDVFSRTGPVRFSSWKFPDKLSCNLDMVALLEQYDFVDGEDAFSQHSHIVLLELVVDRLLLLLQSFNAYIEPNRSSHRRETQQKGCLSVGLVVRNYWINLVQLQGAYKDFKKQTKANGGCDGTETAPTLRHCLSAPSSTSSFMLLPQGQVPSSPNSSPPCHFKANCVNVGCQTFESSLLPCDACHQVQSLLRKTGLALVELFQGEGLPSSLQPFLAAVEDTLELGQMTAGDVTQWANMQLRDLRRLAKHLQDVRGTVKPLEDKLAVAEAERERFRSQLDTAQKEFKEEMEKHQVTTVQLEFSLRKAERCVKEMELKLQEEQQQYRREIISLEETNSKLKEKVAAQHDTLQALEHEKTTLQEKVRSEEQSGCKLQQRIQQLEGQISENQLHLDKEKSKYISVCHQQESMQSKQESLLKRVNVLDEECEELQRQLGESEEKQVVLHNELQQMSEERQQVKAQLSQQQDICAVLQQEKLTLETREGELQSSVSRLEGAVQALRERERLLVAFPELSPQAQPQSTGNVLLDMEQQLRANSIRIKVLKEENTTLQNTIVKLREKAQNTATRDGQVEIEASPPLKWNLLSSTPEDLQENYATQLRKSPSQSSGVMRRGSSDRRKEAGREESGLKSAGSGDRVSTTSPLSLQPHFQTLHLNTGSTAAKSHKEAHSRSLFSRHRGVNHWKN